MKCVTALVPMKAHSERMPNKNISLLNGRPLFHWVLEALSNSRYVHKIIVNTDSEIISDEAVKLFNVQAIKRPEFLCGDMVGIQPLIEYDLSHSVGQFYLQTHSTNPLLTTKTIDLAIEKFLSNPLSDSLFSVTPVQKRFFKKNLTPINHDPQVLLRTQDLEVIYEENSCIYLFSKSSNLLAQNRIGLAPDVYEMDPLEAVDIDNPIDLSWADFLMRQGS